MSWASISPKLSGTLIEILKSCNYLTPTPVQSSSIPYFLNNKDVCVEAVTGSGKTLAFVVPLLNIFIEKWSIFSENEFKVFAIILSPTRELAEQTYLVVDKLARLINSLMVPSLLAGNIDKGNDNRLLRCQLIVGGSKTMESDMRQFADMSGAHLLVATPGRLEYLLNKGAKISLKQNNDMHAQTTFNTISLAQSVKELEFLVLDEGDRFLELGFLPSLQNILDYLPKQRRTCLFSATLNEKMESLIKAGLRNPVSIVVKQKLNYSNNTSAISNSSHTTPNIPLSLSCYYSLIDYESKWAYLALILYHHDVSPLYHLLNYSKSLKESKNYKILAFVSNYSSAQYISKAFKLYHQHHIQNVNTMHKSPKMQFELFCLHRKMRSNDRTKVLKKFKADDSKTSVKQSLKTSKKSKGTCTVKILISTDLMARGIDVEGIDWVIHADPPSDIEKFIHRSGRTARIQTFNDSSLHSSNPEKLITKDPCNSAGNTLILLHEGQEENFIDFLAINQNIMVKSFPPISDCESALNSSKSKLRKLIVEEAKNDRAFMLKGIKAFVSHVRSYRENKLALIFRVQDLKLGKIANSFGLLYLPRMPELAKSYRKILREQGIKQNAARQAHQKISTDMEERLGFIKPIQDINNSTNKEVNSIFHAESSIQSEKFQETPEILSNLADIEDQNANKSLTRRQRVKRKQKLDQKDINDFARDAKMLKQIKNHKISVHKFDEFYSGF